MRIATVLTIVAALCFATPVAAERYYYPGGGSALFSIDIPGSWQVEAEDAILHSGPPDGSLYLGLWALSEAEAENIGVAVEEIVNNMVHSFELEEEDEFEQNGMPFATFSGLGTNKEDGSPMNVGVAIFSPDGNTFCTVVYFGSPNAQRVHDDALSAILGSIQRE